MTRRKLSAMLAAMPLIGGWFAAPIVAATAPTDVLRIQDKLVITRDLILPELYGLNHVRGPNLEMDIAIDFVHDCLVVKGWCESKKKLLGFVIVRGSIEDQSYKANFRDNVLNLIECLKDDNKTQDVSITLGDYQAVRDKYVAFVQNRRLVASESSETYKPKFLTF